MSRIEKLKLRFLAKPKDFTWDELGILLREFGYKEMNAGKTSGSRVRFIHPCFEPVVLHKPHPKPILKLYQVKQLLEFLRNRKQL